MSSRAFRMEDQQAFAGLSGDYNPQHLDAAHARQRIFGAVVVHGVNLAMWGLEHVLETTVGPACLARFKVAFRNPVSLDEQISLRTLPGEEGRFAVEVGQRRCSIAGEFRQPAEAGCPTAVLPFLAASLPCKERSFVEAAQCEGQLPLYLDPLQLQTVFPQAAIKLPAIQVAQILATTRLTGMECPGLSSVFESLDLRFTSDAYAVPPPDIRHICYRVSYSDERFRLIRLRVWGAGFEGELSTLFRPPLATDGAIR
jgi:hypothetical protein